MIRPEKRKIRRANAGIRWWLLLAVHAVIFAVVIAFYPDIQGINPAVLTDNRLRLLLPAWGVFLLLHLIWVFIVDNRISAKRKRDERILKRLAAMADPNRKQVPQLPAGTMVMERDTDLENRYNAANMESSP